jgi:predicted MPP superfamily phosphohydrolase
MLIHMLTVFLGLVAGLGLYLALISRILSFLRGSIFKPLVALSSLILLVGGFGALAYLDPGLPSLLASFIAIVFLGVFGVTTWAIQRRSRGAREVDRNGVKPSLLRPVTTTDLQVLRYEIPLTAWRGPRLRIAHLSDFHITDRLPFNFYLSVIAHINRTSPDLVFITGDFVTDVGFISLLPEILQPIQSRLGTYAILGNHDYWADAQLITQTLQGNGVRFLGDGWQRLALDGGGRLLLVGCQWPWSNEPCSAPPSRDEEITLALSHTADNIYRLSEAGAAAVFSGHYHGGQICLPGWGPPVIPSRYGRRFAQGHFVVRDTHLFVSAGVGAARPPLRIYCPPDCLIVDLIPATSQT